MSQEGIDDGLAGLVELLETVSERLDALDALTGEDAPAQENRAIRNSQTVRSRGCQATWSIRPTCQWVVMRLAEATSPWDIAEHGRTVPFVR